MFRISKLTDYGIVLLAHLARDGQAMHTARDLAESTHLPLPTVGKLLKSLSRGSFLESERGANGGYRLSRPASQITVAEIVSVLEGPIGVTECAATPVRAGAHAGCEIEGTCLARTNWRKINDVVHRALETVTLAEMSQTAPLRLEVRQQEKIEV